MTLQKWKGMLNERGVKEDPTEFKALLLVFRVTT